MHITNCCDFRFILILYSCIISETLINFHSPFCMIVVPATFMAIPLHLLAISPASLLAKSPCILISISPPPLLAFPLHHYFCLLFYQLAAVSSIMQKVSCIFPLHHLAILPFIMSAILPALFGISLVLFGKFPLHCLAIFPSIKMSLPTSLLHFPCIVLAITPAS